MHGESRLVRPPLFLSLTRRSTVAPAPALAGVGDPQKVFRTSRLGSLPSGPVVILDLASRTWPSLHVRERRLLAEGQTRLKRLNDGRQRAIAAFDQEGVTGDAEIGDLRRGHGRDDMRTFREHQTAVGGRSPLPRRVIRTRYDGPS